MNVFYGLKSTSEVFELSEKICNSIGRKDNDINMLVETCAAETCLGTLPDPTPSSAGAGVSQIDESTFDWLTSKYGDSAYNDAFKDHFNIDLKTVEYEKLRESPLLALIYTRLRYITIPEKIGKTVEERAAQWKKFYNTKFGKGTEQHYIDNVKLYC